MGITNKPLRPCRYPGCCVLTDSGYCSDHQRKREDRRSQEARSWRWMYGTKLWRDKLCPEQLAREPFCRACAKNGIRTRAEDVDHIRDHKGNWTLFADPKNLQSLCHNCHSRKTAKEMKKASKTQELR